MRDICVNRYNDAYIFTQKTNKLNVLIPSFYYHIPWSLAGGVISQILFRPLDDLSPLLSIFCHLLLFTPALFQISLQTIPAPFCWSSSSSSSSFSITLSCLLRSLCHHLLLFFWMCHAHLSLLPTTFVFRCFFISISSRNFIIILLSLLPYL